MRKSARKLSQGFTLVELLVVIAIVIILAVVVLTVINPIELTKQGRDSTRLTDIQSLQGAISMAVQEATGSGTAGILCVGTTAPCSGNSNDAGANTRKSDGSGWVKVNLSSQQAVSVPVLPVDPVNDATYHYTYTTNAAGDAWEIDAKLESSKYQDKMTKDGGNDDALYEIGSSLTVI